MPIETRRIGVWFKSTSPTVDLASDSKDEKKLRKAKRAMERKRKEVKGIGGNAMEKFKSGGDSQLFRSKIPYCFTL